MSPLKGTPLPIDHQAHWYAVLMRPVIWIPVFYVWPPKPKEAA